MFKYLTKLPQAFQPTPALVIITASAAVGGIAIWVLGGVPPRVAFLFPLLGASVSLVLGIFSGIVLIGIVTNTQRDDMLRLAGLAFLGGIAWPFVIPEAVRSMFPDSGELPEALAHSTQLIQFAQDAPKIQGPNEPNPLLAEVSAFVNELPDAGPVREVALQATIDQLTLVEPPRRQLTIDALEEAVGDLDNAQENRLNELRESSTAGEGRVFFRDPIETRVLNHLMDPPEEFPLIETGNAQTDEQGRYGFTVEVPSCMQSQRGRFSCRPYRRYISSVNGESHIYRRRLRR